eukprot:scaffold99957_cov66-Phaeocystis_antarctica.AAC.3
MARRRAGTNGGADCDTLTSNLLVGLVITPTPRKSNIHRCLCLLPQPDVLLATGLRLEEAEAAALRKEALLPEGQRLACAEHLVRVGVRVRVAVRVLGLGC